MDLKAGDQVKVSKYDTLFPGKGLSYPEFQGKLLEHAGESEGWDVVDVLDVVSGEIVSIYCFSIIR